MAIRVGLIGLTTITPKEGAYTPGTWGLIHLEAIQASPNYELVALCNSTAEKAQKSIEYHKLQSHVKAYGSPEDLANDPNVDLIVVSVSIKKHYELVKPALLKKKHVFIEFPITPALKEAEELADLAKKANVKTIIGTQANADPGFTKLREIVNSGTIGGVLTSTWNIHSPVVTHFGWPQVLQNSLMLDGGIGVLDLVLGHSFAPFLSILGTFKSTQSTVKISNKTTKILDDSGNVVDPEFHIDAPDLVIVQGVLESGAIASIHVRCSQSSVNDIGSRWIITGSKGEIELTAGTGFSQALSQPKLNVKKFDTGEVENVDLGRTEPEYITSLGDKARNMGRLYEGFATDTETFADIQTNLKVQRFLTQVKADALWA